MGRKDILGQEWEVECMGCAMPVGEMTPPGGIIKESKHFYMHQDPEIPIKGFLVIASKKHYRSIEEFSMEEMQDFASLLHESRLLLHKIGINEVTIIQEERSSHFHLWLFPWLDWMVDKFEKKSIAHIREIMNFARDTMKTEENIQVIMAAVEILKKQF